jgi:hypothetical protein
MGRNQRARPAPPSPAPHDEASDTRLLSASATSWLLSAWAAAFLALNWRVVADTIWSGLQAFSLAGRFTALPDGTTASVAWLLALLFAAVGAGRVLLRLARFDCAHLEEELLLSLGLGLGALSLGTFLLGLAGKLHLLHDRRILGCAAAAAGAAHWFAAPFRPALLSGRQTGATKVIVSLIAALAALNFLGALGPEVLFDSLVYHLGLPKLYLLNGKLGPTPHNVYSGIPFNGEMLYALGLASGGEMTAKVFPWVIGLASAMAVWLVAAEGEGGETGPLAALIFYSIPMVADTTWHAYVDLNWCFYVLLAFCVLATGPTERRGGIAAALLAGTFAGLALGTKYTAVVAIPLTLILYWRRAVAGELSYGKCLSLAAAFAFMAALVFSPWLLKNRLFYGNPVFPFFNEAFGGRFQVDWRGLAADAGARSAAGMLESLRLFLPKLDNDDRLSLGFCLYLLAPLLFLRRWTNPRARELAVYALAALALWFAGTSMVRFMLFALPALAALLASSVSRGVALRLAVAACALNGLHSLRLWRSYETWNVVLAGMPREEFLSRQRQVYPTPPFPAIDYINKNAPPGARVLFIHEGRGYHCDRDFVAASPFAQNPIVPIAESSKNGGEIARRLHAEGFTHILFNRMEMQRLQRGLTLSPGAEKAYLEFLGKHARPVFESRNETPGDYRWVTVLEVLPPRG